MEFDFKQLRRGLTKYLDYDIKKNALDREIARKAQEKADESERKIKLESDEAQRKSLLDLAKLDTPAGIEAQSRLLPGLNREKSEQFLKAKTFLSPLLREKQYGTASTLGLGEFGETEEDKASAEAEKMLGEARKRQAELATARIGRVKLEQQRIQQQIKKVDQQIMSGKAGKASDLKTIYNVLSDQRQQIVDDMERIAEDFNLDPIDVQTQSEELRQYLKEIDDRQQIIINLMGKYHFPTGTQKPPPNVRPNIGPLTQQGQFNPAARPKLDY